ncbi:Protein FAM70A [Chelonia mydas]|uniref:Transmembrane protein 255A n=1 Tax=Chelonia mydas TaxID=8469 RepID=M7C4K3_CHEMY|nr:Protein FAM70A [Chelonia mydas]
MARAVLSRAGLESGAVRLGSGATRLGSGTEIRGLCGDTDQCRDDRCWEWDLLHDGDRCEHQRHDRERWHNLDRCHERDQCRDCRDSERCHRSTGCAEGRSIAGLPLDVATGVWLEGPWCRHEKQDRRPLLVFSWVPCIPLLFVFTQGICNPQRRGPCTPKIKTNTCFCCDLYNCGNRVEISGGYYEYIDVSSCQDIIHLYHLLWSATILNIVGLFLGIITAAILGGFKDMTPSLPTLNCTVENAHPSVSYYSRPQVTSYNTYYHSTPHLPPYSAYDFQHSSVFPASTPSGLSDDPQSMSPSPSYMWSSSAPPRYSPPYFPPFEKPPPYTP